MNWAIDDRYEGLMCGHEKSDSVQTTNARMVKSKDDELSFVNVVVVVGKVADDASKPSSPPREVGMLHFGISGRTLFPWIWRGALLLAHSHIYLSCPGARKRAGPDL